MKSLNVAMFYHNLEIYGEVSLNWPDAVDCGEDELVVSQTAVKLVCTFPQEVNCHLNSLRTKQLLLHNITALSTTQHRRTMEKDDSNWKSQQTTMSEGNEC